MERHGVREGVERHRARDGVREGGCVERGRVNKRVKVQ